MADAKIIVDFWDVGQGDATVVRLPDGKLVIIDIGPRGSPVVDWLSERSRDVHAVVVTHNDEDHSGGMPSLVNIAALKIEAIYMLVDRNKDCSQFRNIWRPVRKKEKDGKFKVCALLKDTIIWQSDHYSIKVVYPSFSENLDARCPNSTSAIICLYYRDEIKIIWPGDAPMRIVADKCRGAKPYLLHGPHHGGPTDRDQRGFSDWAKTFEPYRLFISVGTANHHGHPNANYLRFQASRGCHITCTQLTGQCDQRRVDKGEPVVPSAALLGLRATRSGVPCRGCLRLNVVGGDISPDKWDSEHHKRVKGLREPKCLPAVRRS